MNSKRERRQARANRASKEFPGLPREWADDVIIELRLRDVSGARIMEILTEAERHCIESGDSPGEAFGDPKEYAASFDFDGQRRAPGAGLGPYIAAGASMLFGCLLVMRHFNDLAAGEASQFTVGGVASLLLVVVLFCTVGVWLRWVAQGPRGRVLLGSVAWVAAFIGLQVWGGPVLATVPALWPVLVGAVLGLAGAVGLTVLTLRDPQDLLTPPGAPATRDRAFDHSQLLAIWILPAFTVFMSGFAWFTR